MMLMNLVSYYIVYSKHLPDFPTLTKSTWPQVLRPRPHVASSGLRSQSLRPPKAGLGFRV